MRNAFIVLLLVSACGDNLVRSDTRNLDGVYHVRLEYKENTCDRDWRKETWTDLYSVQFKFDGNYDFVPFRDDATGWPPTFSDVPIAQNGAVDHPEEWMSGTTWHLFTNTLKGHIDEKSLDLTVVLNWEMRDNVTPCHQTAHIVGERWQVADPEAVEGLYLVTASIYDNDDGFVCDDQPQQELQVARFQMVISAPKNGEARVDFLGGGARFRLPVVETKFDDQTNISAQTWFTFIGFMDVPSKVVGDFRPDKIDFDWRIWDPFGMSTSCYFRYHIVGKRILPGESLTGEFRAVVVHTDECTGIEETRDEKYVVTEQLDGRIKMVGRFGLTTWLSLDESGSFHAAPHQGGGASTYDGFITPEQLQFDYTFKSDSEARDCGITHDVSAVARFLK